MYQNISTIIKILMNNQTINHISIIGGAGHVGLPLGLAFASKNFKIHLIDKK